MHLNRYTELCLVISKQCFHEINTKCSDSASVTDIQRQETQGNKEKLHLHFSKLLDVLIRLGS